MFQFLTVVLVVVLVGAEDCSSGDAYCAGVNNDAGSYCKWWLTEVVCQGGNQPCSCGTTTTTAPETTTTAAPTTTTVSGKRPCSVVDEECKSLSGNTGSYCKYWQSPSVCEFSDDPCDCEPSRELQDDDVASTPCPTGDAFCASVKEGSYCMFYQQAVTGNCQGTDTPCTCTDCVSGDSTCIQEYGWNSYCKSWNTPSVCQGGDSVCSCGAATTSAPTTTTGGDCGDSKCIRLNGEESYCKTWQTEPHCQGGDQDCKC